MYSCSNPQLESKDYNKMHTNVGDDDGDGGNAVVSVRDDDQSS
jgi:hypothetical protein